MFRHETSNLGGTHTWERPSSMLRHEARHPGLNLEKDGIRPQPALLRSHLATALTPMVPAAQDLLSLLHPRS